MSKINGTVGRKPGGGWDEEDVPSVINTNSVSVSKPKDPVVISKAPITFVKEPEVKKNSFEMETKLIDDILKPAGVTIKPSDSQLNDFIRRIKTLNKDVIGKILIERINNLATPTEDQNQVKQLMKALYVVECILQKKIEGYQSLLSDQSILLILIENSFSNNKKVCEIVNSILILLGERKPTVSSSNQTITSLKSNIISGNNNVNLFDEIVNSTSSSKEETFSGLEIRNKNNNSQTTNVKPNGFTFIKGKSTGASEEQQNTNNKSNPELLYVLTNNNNTNVANNINNNKVESSAKPGFNFIKGNKPTNSNTDDLSNVFKNLNIVSKRENQEKPENVNTTLQEALNKKIDLDKLYSELNNSAQQNQYNNSGLDYNNNQTFQSNYNNINIQSQNINYFQNFNLNIGDLSNNLKIGENYFPLDMSDYIKNQENPSNQVSETKNEKDHFDFVNDLMKKKK